MMRLIDADKLQKAIPAEEDSITGMGMTYDEAERSRRMIDCGTEKAQCFDDYENGELIMSDEKCLDCEHRYTCRFMKRAMDEVVYGD